MSVRKGLIVIFALLAVASALTDDLLKEQAQMEALEDFNHVETPTILLETELDSEDPALQDLGIDLSMDVGTAFATVSKAVALDKMSMAETDAEIEAENTATVDQELAAEAKLEEQEEAAAEELAETGSAEVPMEHMDVFPVVTPSGKPAIMVRPREQFHPVEYQPEPAPPVVHNVQLRTVVTPVFANQLLTRLVDLRNPLSPYEVAHQLPDSARIALMKVLAKSNDPEVQVSVTASFLAAFSEVKDTAEEAEEQAKASALLEAEDEVTAVRNTEPHVEEKLETPPVGQRDTSLYLLETEADAEAEETAEVDAEAEVETEEDPVVAAQAVAAKAAAAAKNSTAAVPAVPNKKLQKKNIQNAENLDSGVSALRKYSEVLEGEALILSKKLEELKRLHSGSIFKAMERGPVGRRETAKERQQVFTNGMRSWEASAFAEKMRGRVVSTAEADRVYTVEPTPKF